MAQANYLILIRYSASNVVRYSIYDFTNKWTSNLFANSACRSRT